MPAGGFAGPPAIEIDTHCEGRRWWFGDANLQRYSSEIAACCKVASNTNRRGAVGVHGFQVTVFLATSGRLRVHTGEGSRSVNVARALVGHPFWVVAQRPAASRHADCIDGHLMRGR
jgi:hypothetical protein